jgi:hypothetical protein
MRDAKIREAIHNRILHKYHADDNSLVLDELGLRHGAVRADIAVVNGILHGYEIKSDADTLVRLPSQVDAYSLIFDKATLVTSHRHLEHVLDIVPSWWGILLAEQTRIQSIKFTTYRKSTKNPDRDYYALAQLLWKNEAIEILHRTNKGKISKRLNRATLYKSLIEELAPKELHYIVCQTLKSRQGWRDRSQPS